MLESLEKLRKCTICDSCGRTSHGLDVNEIADAIQSEVNERYMKLPVDADGVPIRPGDQMTDDSRRTDGLGMAKWDVESVNGCSFFDMSGNAHIPIDCHHVKPDQLKELLRDYGADVAHQLDANPDKTVNEATIAKYAERIRELLGGERR